MNRADIFASAPSPFGPLLLTFNDGFITHIGWEAHDEPAAEESDEPVMIETARQLAEYFDGKRQQFDLPLKPKGDSFQQAVCAAMLAVPYGETTTYGAIAEKLDTYGQPVGNACGANSIPIIIPCHRVLGANGIGGYSGDGGVERKIELLKHEGGFPYLL